MGTQLTGDNAAAHDWSLLNRSTYMCGGILSGITGNRADGLIIDDPFKGRQEAESPVIRDKTWDAYLSDLYTRLKPNGWIVLINTRWHGGDLSGRILPENYNGESGWIESQDGEMWYVLCLQAQCEREDDPLGRKIGEYLWTEWFPVSWWENTKQVQKKNWDSLYQQRPSIGDGGIFQKAWWKDWTGAEPPDYDYIMAVYDTALEEGQENDASGCIIWGVFEKENAEGVRVANLIMLGAWDKTMIYPDLKRQVIQDWKDRRPNVILIEKKSSGHSLIQDLRQQKIPGAKHGLPVKAFMPRDKSKVFRANISSDVLESGCVWLPKKKLWAQRVMDHCAKFPNIDEKEYADICSMSFLFLRRKFWLGLDISDDSDYFEEPKTRKLYGN